MTKIADLRDLGADDLTQRLTELDDKMFRLRLQQSMGQADSGDKIHGVRRDIARIKTLLREKSGSAA
jgi:large subunit ribosomal protein L29